MALTMAAFGCATLMYHDWFITTTTRVVSRERVLLEKRSTRITGWRALTLARLINAPEGVVIGWALARSIVEVGLKAEVRRVHFFNL